MRQQKSGWRPTLGRWLHGAAEVREAGGAAPAQAADRKSHEGGARLHRRLIANHTRGAHACTGG